jgi:hypothetical protein
MTERKTYLGDGAYAEINGWGELTISAPRGSSEHYVVLGPNEYAALLAFVEANRRPVELAQPVDGDDREET